MQAKDLMTRNLTTVSPDHSVWHAARIMLAKGVSGLPVVDDTGVLLGIITEGDLLRRSELGTAGPISDGAARDQDLARDYVRTRSWKVGDVMSPEVITIEEDTSIQKIATLLGEHRIKRLPVLQNGRLVGVVGRADLLKVVSAGKPDIEVKGDEAARRAIVARLQDAIVYLSRQPEIDVAAGRVRVTGTVRSSAERDAIRIIVESVTGPGFDDRIEIEGE
jgi:CBS domain-containing protein